MSDIKHGFMNVGLRLSNGRGGSGVHFVCNSVEGFIEKIKCISKTGNEDFYQRLEGEVTDVLENHNEVLSYLLDTANDKYTRLSLVGGLVNILMEDEDFFNFVGLWGPLCLDVLGSKIDDPVCEDDIGKIVERRWLPQGAKPAKSMITVFDKSKKD